MILSDQEKKQLKELAIQTIRGVLFGTKAEKFELGDSLKEKNGAFVTIKRKGHLRGCIGYISAVLPLDKTIREMAIQAAFHDPRFPPLEKDEFDDMEIEISVLTPMKRIDNIEEIEVGTHGLYIEKDAYSGLLLPQVATEYHWDRKTFLENVCTKAGLPANAWKEKNAAIHIFSAEVF